MKNKSALPDLKEIKPDPDWERFREVTDRYSGQKFRFPEYLSAMQLWRLFDARFGIGIAAFYVNYRWLFPLEYYGMYRGRPSQKRISWRLANYIIDQILSGDIDLVEAQRQTPNKQLRLF